MIPQGVLDQKCMLAEQSKTVTPIVDEAVAWLQRSGHFFDLKFDGIRCLAYIDGGVVKLINRNDKDITYRYPDLVEALLATYPNETRVLDGEVVVLKDGLPHFAHAHRRDAQSNAASALALSKNMPATYMVFDMLCTNGDDLRKLPYSARRALLKTESGRLKSASHDVVQWSRSELEGLAMWEVVRQLGMEGLIAKNPSAQYRAGRSNAWIKLKPTKSLSAMVTGFDAGKNARSSTFGNLHLALLDQSGATPKFLQIGKVGSGFTEADLREILPMLTSPPAGGLLVEVEYQEVSATNQLRFPVFKGIRTDITVTDCDVTQLKQ